MHSQRAGALFLFGAKIRRRRRPNYIVLGAIVGQIALPRTLAIMWAGSLLY